MVEYIPNIKIVLVGAETIGKSIIEEFTKKFEKDIISNKSNNSISITIPYNNNNKNNNTLNFSIYYTGSKVGPFSLLKTFSENTSAVFMVYDKKGRESFEILQKYLNEVNDYYQNAFKALIVNNADYKEIDQETENKMDEFSNNCDTTFKLNKDKDFQGLYNIFLTIA